MTKGKTKALFANQEYVLEIEAANLSYLKFRNHQLPEIMDVREEGETGERRIVLPNYIDGLTYYVSTECLFIFSVMMRFVTS